MNSREKAEHLFSERYGGKEFFEEEIAMLTDLLDQHAAEAIAGMRHNYGEKT